MQSVIRNFSGRQNYDVRHETPSSRPPHPRASSWGREPATGLVTVEWNRDLVLERLELGEDSLVEFKEACFKANRVVAPRREVVADELSALGNTLGGTLIFSVSDAGEVRRLNRRQLDLLEAFVTELCSDSIRPPLPFITQRVALPSGPVLVVVIEQSESVHKSPGGYLRRQGSSKRELSPEALQRLFQQRSRSGLVGPDEAIVAGTGRNSLDPALVDRFLSSRTTDLVDAQLEKLGLLRRDDSGVMRATVAGILLATKRPDQHIHGALIEAVCYSGTVLGRATQYDAASITGPLDRQVREAVHFAKRNTRVSARKVPERIEMPQFGRRSVFEAIVNAVVHRDYTMENAKTRFFIFDDRLELYSPGALPNTLPIEAMRSRQATRNETIASVLRRLPVGDIEGAGDRRYFLELRGEGVPLIYEQTMGLTGRDPIYEVLGRYELRLTIPSAPPPAEGIAGEVSVSAAGQPLAGARVVALYPNTTWMVGETDTFGRVGFDFHSELPITVLCAAPGYAGRVERGWRPPDRLSVELEELRGGGSIIFTDQTGKVPGMAGRVNPVLDTHDRTYLYAFNIAIDEGRPQPVHFKLNRPILLTDVHGVERMVRFVEMIGRSGLLEYELVGKGQQ